MVLGFTQPQTGTSTSSPPGGKALSRLCTKYGIFDVSQPYGPHVLLQGYIYIYI
jgi:hypothetical protein